ncbi:MAG: GNAT family N-acetyltransferase [Candidatus Thermoplasmatota archaeon]|nr:GNAT family N-acetyltransferase [Candidatus Thermoplasmatota archaeon]MDA8143216.1 GNAT family N-acetyltransferase [Thermoplasmatales archaeon]
MTDRNMVERLVGEYGKKLYPYLSSQLPFTANMIHAVTTFPERCETFVVREDDSISGCLIIFHSGYNPHIWHDPLAWITGSEESAPALLRSIKYEKITIQAPFKLEEDLKIAFPDSIHFRENLMLNKLDHTPEITSTDQRVLKLDRNNAEGSLNLAGYSERPADAEVLAREARFINERLVYGILHDGLLVSRGAIMSINSDISTVGAFFTSREHRGKGYASDVIRRILKDLAKFSSYASLFVRSDNSTAKSLYENLGFRSESMAIFTDHNTGLIP